MIISCITDTHRVDPINKLEKCYDCQRCGDFENPTGAMRRESDFELKKFHIMPMNYERTLNGYKTHRDTFYLCSLCFYVYMKVRAENEERILRTFFPDYIPCHIIPLAKTLKYATSIPDEIRKNRENELISRLRSYPVFCKQYLDGMNDIITILATESRYIITPLFRNEVDINGYCNEWRKLFGIPCQEVYYGNVPIRLKVNDREHNERGIIEEDKVERYLMEKGIPYERNVIIHGENCKTITEFDFVTPNAIIEVKFGKRHSYVLGQMKKQLEHSGGRTIYLLARHHRESYRNISGIRVIDDLDIVEHW